MTDDLLTAQEVADLFRVDEKTVTRWLQLGKLPGHKTPGGQWRVNRAAIELFIPAPTLEESCELRRPGSWPLPSLPPLPSPA